MYLYYITDRKQLSAHNEESARLLLERIRLSAEAGIDAIQLREKDLNVRDMLELGRRAVEIVRQASSHTRLFINSRVDVAIACDVDGVHLRGDDISAADARVVLVNAGMAHAQVGVSCHMPQEIARAEGNGADLAFFGPIFERSHGEGETVGIAELQRVCQQRRANGSAMPVLALGGITPTNAAECLKAGAAGIAGIRMFQTGNVLETISKLRALEPA